MGRCSIKAVQQPVRRGDCVPGSPRYLACSGWDTDLLDEPIMIQSLTARENVENEEKLLEFVEFARRLCKEANQERVAVIFNDVIHFIAVR